MDAIPVLLLFVINIVIIIAAILLGYSIGNRHNPQLKKNLETVTSTNSTAVLGILGFMLVFTFGIVYNLFESKRDLVRQEANLISTAYLRTDFLPDMDRRSSQELIRKYLDLRLEAVKSSEIRKVHIALKESNQIQNQLWNIAVVNGKGNMNSDVAALYIKSLNEMFDMNSMRVSVGLETRLPAALWIILYLLTLMGMFGIGYQAAVSSSSKRSLLTPIMILTFAIVMTLIASLDRSDSTIIKVSQQPLENLQSWMSSPM